MSASGPRPFELTNFTVWGRAWFPDGWRGLRRLCTECGLAGIELLGEGATPESAPPRELVRGVHLGALGSWLELAGLDVPHFGGPGPRFAGCRSYGALVRACAQELRQAAELNPAYVVWHGYYTPYPQAFGGPRQLTSAPFLDRLADLVLETCTEYSPPFKLCFENGFGVGVGPHALDSTVAFLDRLRGLPVGLVFDLGHHLNVCGRGNSPGAACRELARVAQEYQARGLQTTVLHLHWTPPKLVGPQIWERMEAQARRAPASAGELATLINRSAAEFYERTDRHQPLAHPLLPQAVAALAPRYVVHELGAGSLPQHRAWLLRQARAMRDGRGSLDYEE